MFTDRIVGSASVALDQWPFSVLCHLGMAIRKLTTLQLSCLRELEGKPPKRKPHSLFCNLTLK